MIELSIIVCTKNDADAIDRCLMSIHRVMLQETIAAEVLVVDDASTDGTVERAAELGHELTDLHLRILQRAVANPGFGALVRFGMAMSSGQYCALVAADGTDPVELLPKMVTELRSGKQLVICTRMDDDRIRTRPLRFYQSVYRTAIRLILGEWVHDSTNGFRAFERPFMQTIGLSANKFNICPEMAFKTLLAGGLLSYVPEQRRATGDEGSERFKLSYETPGYAWTLLRAGLHRIGVRWF